MTEDITIFKVCYQCGRDLFTEFEGNRGICFSCKIEQSLNNLSMYEPDSEIRKAARSKDK